MCIQRPYEIVLSPVLLYTMYPDEDSRIPSGILVELCRETRWNLSLRSLSPPNYSVPLFDSSRKSEIQSLKFDSPPRNLLGRDNLLFIEISIFTTRDHTPPHYFPLGQVPSYVRKISCAHLAKFHTLKPPTSPSFLTFTPCTSLPISLLRVARDQEIAVEREFTTSRVPRPVRPRLFQL